MTGMFDSSWSYLPIEVIEMAVGYAHYHNQYSYHTERAHAQTNFLRTASWYIPRNIEE